MLISFQATTAWFLRNPQHMAHGCSCAIVMLLLSWPWTINKSSSCRESISAKVSNRAQDAGWSTPSWGGLQLSGAVKSS